MRNKTIVKIEISTCIDFVALVCNILRTIQKSQEGLIVSITFGALLKSAEDIKKELCELYDQANSSHDHLLTSKDFD